MPEVEAEPIINIGYGRKKPKRKAPQSEGRKRRSQRQIESLKELPADAKDQLSNRLESITSRLDLQIIKTGNRRNAAVESYKPNEKDRNDVILMASYGIPLYGIASVLRIDVRTLENHFAHELAAAVHIRNAEVAHGLLQTALAGNVAAQIFWLKCRAGWRSIDYQPPQPDVPVVNRMDYSKLSDEEIRTLMALYQKASRSAAIDVNSEQIEASA